ncbi:hypothetical protein [Methylobacterium brachythecii]|uniref:Uncharacterized protein n=1 Tax=Methylobacterium brachythecii TaxID=1176177 RepID=A0A7W6AG80_9HYPH|nr:hypothetical protein [Methylobacterium brachythecii]MBB3902742.1 hypothetical protein [Methylobacterium brachythecii]GLS42584.1 hypothetical protein GCM10007884_05690 [Methylobacterium brachythecii]
MTQGRLYWQHTWPEEGPDFVLQRERSGEPETIGRVMLHRPVDANVDYWMWTLTSRAGAVGIEKPVFEMSGSLVTQRGARDALIVAWRREEAFRREAQNHPAYPGLSSYAREFIVNGQPPAAKWERELGD